MHICQCFLSLSLCCIADRCSCSQINRVARISASCLHAKNTQLRLRQRLTEQAQTYWITPAHTHQHLTAIPLCKQHSLGTRIHFTPWYTCTWPSHASCLTQTLFWPQTLLFHSRGTYVSLLLPHPVAPWTPRRQQAAGLTGCRTLWDGMDDNLRPPRGSARDRKIDRKAEWRNREKKKETRAHRSEL